MRELWVRIPATAWAALFDSAVLHWLLSLGYPVVVIWQRIRNGGNIFVLDKKDSGGGPLPHQSYQMWASMSRYTRKHPFKFTKETLQRKTNEKQ